MSAIPVDRNVQADSQMVDSLLQVNRMLYKMPPSISIANSRQYQTGFPQESSYTMGRTMVWDAQTGSQFVDGRTSYLRFKVTSNSGTGDFGKGGAMNLIDRVLIRSRQGKELTRLEGAGLLTNFKDRYSCSRNWFETSGIAEGYASGTGSSAVDSAGDETSVWTSGVVFCIPLSKFPFFNNARLLPPQIMEGLRIELTLASVAEAIVSGGTAPTALTISDIEIKWDVYDIADQFKRAVMQMSAQQGLNLVHKEFYRTTVSGAASQFDFDIKKAASKALQVVVIPRLTADIASSTKDSAEACPYAFTKQQYHVGGTYWPNAPLETPVQTGAGTAEAYLWNLAAWGALPCHKEVDPKPSEFTATYGCSSASLNKSQTSDIQGSIINNSRALLAEITFANATARSISAYLCHLRAVKVFPSNVVVRD
jgi:hypothetical protein